MIFCKKITKFLSAGASSFNSRQASILVKPSILVNPISSKFQKSIRSNQIIQQPHLLTNY